MFLFILENFGTQELLLVGLAALILLGPRRLPEMARKAGKIMSEFRGTANEFKETWQREVNFEEEAKALDIKALEEESVKREVSHTNREPVNPMIKEVDPSRFHGSIPADPFQSQNEEAKKGPVAQPTSTSDLNDKKNWL